MVYLFFITSLFAADGGSESKVFDTVIVNQCFDSEEKVVISTKSSDRPKDTKDQTWIPIQESELQVGTVLLIDNSNTMKNYKNFRTSLKNIINQVSSSDGVKIISFVDKPKQLVDWTTDKGVLKTTASSINFAGQDETSIFYEVIQEVLSDLRSKNDFDVYRLIVISDGFDETTSEDDIKLHRSGIKQLQKELPIDIQFFVPPTNPTPNMKKAKRSLIQFMKTNKFSYEKHVSTFHLDSLWVGTLKKTSFQEGIASVLLKSGKNHKVKEMCAEAKNTFLWIIFFGCTATVVFGFLFWRKDKKKKKKENIKEQLLYENSTVVFDSENPSENPDYIYIHALSLFSPSESRSIHIFPNSYQRNIVTIGGDKNNAMVFVDDKGISGKHLEIEKGEGIFRVKDLNSKNGSLLNQKPMNPHQPYPLKDRDQISIGSQNFVVQIERKAIQQ